MGEKVVYLLEDDKDISDLCVCALEIASIKCMAFYNIASFKKQVLEEKPDLCILDIMLPDGNGLDVLKELKNNYPQMPVIMLSALGSETQKVMGLNLGADDYISKPFGTMEFVARINANLRRVSDNSITTSNITIDPTTHSVKLDDKEIILNKKEFELLHYFIKNPNIVISRERLLESVWGYETGQTRTVDNHILRLRKLGFIQIETVFGIGYKFISK